MPQQRPGVTQSDFQEPRSGDAGVAIVIRGPAAPGSAGPGVQPSRERSSAGSQGRDKHSLPAEVGLPRADQRADSGDVRGYGPVCRTVQYILQVSNWSRTTSSRPQSLSLISKTKSVFNAPRSRPFLQPAAWLLTPYSEQGFSTGTCLWEILTCRGMIC